jgi:peptidoglycan/LPS O-acetylase OafA/YrhL
VRARPFGAPASGHHDQPYVPALDGIRALAVAAVVVYHANPEWLPGGFLGVDVFFVLSGYLITSLLLAEWRRRGRIALRGFWLRRARRLLPGLYLLLAATLTYSAVRQPGELTSLRGDVAAAFSYVTNWYLILHHQSYFETFGSPPMLRHLWSLAVEEQFYLAWPVVCCLGLLRRRHAALLVLAGATATAILCGALYDPGSDASRVYYGTDTHSVGLLVGAALALYLGARGGEVRRATRAHATLLCSAAAGAGLGALAACSLLLDDQRPFLYRGGFALVAVASAGLIAAIVHPEGRLIARWFGCAPLRWVGLRSYSIYLWHWPVLVALSPHGNPVEASPQLVVGEVAVTLLLSAVSYRWVEKPVRSGALGRAWRTWRADAPNRRTPRRLVWPAGVGGVLASAAALGVIAAQATPEHPPPYLSVAALHLSHPPWPQRRRPRARSPRGDSTSPPRARRLRLRRWDRHHPRRRRPRPRRRHLRWVGLRPT